MPSPFAKIKIVCGTFFVDPSEERVARSRAVLLQYVGEVY